MAHVEVIPNAHEVELEAGPLQLACKHVDVDLVDEAADVSTLMDQRILFGFRVPLQAREGWLTVVGNYAGTIQPAQVRVDDRAFLTKRRTVCRCRIEVAIDKEPHRLDEAIKGLGARETSDGLVPIARNRFQQSGAAVPGRPQGVPVVLKSDMRIPLAKFCPSIACPRA